MSSRDALTVGEKRRLNRLANDILDWSIEYGRDFPWRFHASTTYQQIVVEVLLQQTTATAVARFYDGFVEKYPNWGALASADCRELEQTLRPLGLWRRRARSLLGLARYAADHEGQFPHNAEEHREIPAVGQYVSNAILLFQHQKATPLLDGNMARVIERFVRPRRLADIRKDPWLQKAASWVVRNEPITINWAMLDFAALVCKARSPRCYDCPVSSRCAFVTAPMREKGRDNSASS